ncbi:MAG: pyrroloquinoline quinone biosynthesis peptide chaperone PqqD [Granulosicoccus sp.]|nr:pyrroloquinoline quinone biosynthesis peptide chaperone PqqD [Granulosicoccus sp.]
MTNPDKVLQESSIPRISAGYRLQFEQAQDTWVLLYPEGMIKLNASAAEILQRCDGVRDLSAVIAQLESDFEQNNLTDDVIGFLKVAQEQKWVVISDV